MKKIKISLELEVYADYEIEDGAMTCELFKDIDSRIIEQVDDELMMMTEDQIIDAFKLERK